MLVLSRKTAQVIHIGDDIRVTVIKLAGGSVRLGIEAPKEMNIARAELLKKEVAHEPG